MSLKEIVPAIKLQKNTSTNNTIGMTINSLKSSCLRIGPRHTADIDMLIINNQPLSWSHELPYLGVTLLAGKLFQISLQKFKQKL